MPHSRGDQLVQQRTPTVPHEPFHLVIGYNGGDKKIHSPVGQVDSQRQRLPCLADQHYDKVVFGDLNFLNRETVVILQPLQGARSSGVFLAGEASSGLLVPDLKPNNFLKILFIGHILHSFRKELTLSLLNAPSEPLSF